MCMTWLSNSLNFNNLFVSLFINAMLQVKLSLAVGRQHMQAACFVFGVFALDGMYLKDLKCIPLLHAY